MQQSLRRLCLATGAALLGLGLAATHSRAQAPDSLQRRYLLPALPTFELAARGRSVAPGITIGTPAAFGADGGDAFVGAGFQHRTRFEDRPDGGVVAGFGVGDARRLAGLELAVSSFGTFRSCCRGGLSAKLHRVLPWDAAVAVGWENAVTWGHMDGLEEATDAGSSGYAVASKVFALRAVPGTWLSEATLSLGVGGGRFRTEDQVIAREETVNVFGSASLRLAERLSGIVNWTGQDLAAGASWVPLRRVPLLITPGAADLTTEPRFVLGIGYGFDYGSTLPH